jgi:hypothetical protein
MGGLAGVPRRTLALVVFLASLSTSGFSLAQRNQLAGLGGLVDEWFLVGLNLRVHGNLGIQPSRPDVVLAPGYPIFVAGVAALVGHPERVNPRYFVRCMSALFLAQALLLAGASSMLFLWLRQSVATWTAFALALVLGTNPYTVILTGLLHYDILHIFCLVAGCWVWQRALDDPLRGSIPMILSGLIWGACTLVRPLTLILPLFALGALLIRERPSVRPALTRCAWLVLGMLLVVGPYTVRNRRVTGRWIPVNAEGWMAVWGSTERELGVHPNHYNWGELYPEPFMEVFRAVTGQSSYNRAAFIDHNLELEDAFRERALSNIRKHPLVYLRNCVRSLVTLNLQINSVFIEVFQHIQQPGVWPLQDWFRVGHPQDFHDPLAAEAFSVWVGLLEILAAGGVILSVRRGETWPLAAATVYATICAAHAVTYMDLMYYYVKLPFIIVFAAPLLDGMRRPVLRSTTPLGAVAAAALLGFSLLLSFVVLSSA